MTCMVMIIVCIAGIRSEFAVLKNGEEDSSRREKGFYRIIIMVMIILILLSILRG